jgi:U3 small nucleolar ribonucleoprotein protein IMP4
MPGVLITTSHKPSQRTRSFIKDLANILPYSYHVNRGKKTIAELGIEAYRLRNKYVFIVGERRGNPSIIRIYKISYESKPPGIKHYASIKLKGVKLTRENPEASRAYNPETINIDYNMCVSEDCFKLSDLLMEIFGEVISEKPDVLIKLGDEKNHVLFKPLNRLGKICGPIMKIIGVKIID